MPNLFFRTFSQGLQAFVPVAAALAWCYATNQRRLSSAIRWGLLLAIPLTLLAAAAFRNSSHQARDEALLAATAIVITAAWGWWMRESRGRTVLPPRFTTSIAVAIAASLIVSRQTMEVVSVFQIAALELRSLEATMAIVSGIVAAAVVACGWLMLGRRLPFRECQAALWACWAAFIAQCAIYWFHESAEARLLPWSEVLHAATEPYGPDGIYGVHFSELLLLGPMFMVMARWAARRVRQEGATRPLLITRRRGAIAAATFATALWMGMQQGDARPPQARSPARTEDIAAAVAEPHVLFRHTGPGASFGALAVLPLDAPESERRVIGLTCQRLSFGGGHGLCLHLERGVFNTYTAVPFDRLMKTGPSIKLEGLPSRTRVSADGRVGATTVFVIGDSYAADFSTRTHLIDLAAGEVIGELEQFSTWRNGERIRAVDFNFWGVTFAGDGNTFYAALRTAGKTYLVRGELALRRLTVLRENVECPSLSPDNRLLAYKKRIGPSPDSWRVHVLNLQTNVEQIVPAETRFIDDQVEWLDANHLLYGVPRRTTSISDVWVAAIHGAEPARIFIREAESPIVVR